MNAAQLDYLTDEELLRIATHEADELTSSPMELELIKRMCALLDDQKAIEPLTEVIGTKPKNAVRRDRRGYAQHQRRQGAAPAERSQ